MAYNYYVPKSIKLVSGDFFPGEFVVLNVDGKLIKRKVYYGNLDGTYVVIDYSKYGITDFDKKED